MNDNFELKMIKEICTNAEIALEAFQSLKTVYPVADDELLMSAINAAVQIMIAKAFEKERI